MGFYDTEDGVQEYVEAAEGYDGAELVEVLNKHLPQGSTVLELGIGARKGFGTPRPDIPSHGLG